MLEAFAWGVFAAGSLVVGAVMALALPISNRALGLIMAFGSGVLISAVAFELVEEASRTTDNDWAISIGLAAGALTFYLGDKLIDRYAGADRRHSRDTDDDGGSARAIVLGTVLDGIPESAVIGLSLVGGGSIGAAVVAAVFISNIPEAIAGTSGLAKRGWKPSRLLLMWSAIALVSGVAAMIGFSFGDTASNEVLAFVLAFAGGALLTMLADSMIPDAFVLGGDTAGLFTTLGFGLAFALTAI